MRSAHIRDKEIPARQRVNRNNLSYRRQRPKYLAAKLLAIRRQLGASQSEMITLLNVDIGTARISEYESGIREPNLIVLLAYASVARVHLEQIVDDRVQLVIKTKRPKLNRPLSPSNT